jgi:hypothetical protein
MRYTHVLHLSFYLYTIVVVALYIAFGGTELVNAQTVALSVIMVGAFSLALLVPCRRSMELRVAFVTFSALFLCPAVPSYILYPRFFPFGGDNEYPRVKVHDVNFALVLVILGTIVATAAFSFGSHIGSFVPRTKRMIPPSISIGRLVAVGLLFAGLELFIGIRYSRFSTELEGQEGGLFFLTRLFSSDAFTIVALILVAYQWRQLTRLSRLLLVGTILIIVVHRTLSGARSSVLVVLMLSLVIMLDRHGDFRVSWRALKIVIAAALSMILVFPLATIARDYWAYASGAGKFVSPSAFVRQIDKGRPRQTIDYFYTVAARLNGLDPIATIVAGHGNDVKKYVNLRNDVESFINIIVPGTPFPAAIEMSKTFLIIYRGYPERYLEQRYVTSMWMLWGDCYAMFGFVGGLVWMFFICAIFAAGFALLVRSRFQGSVFFRDLYLFFTYSLVVSFGLDTFGATAVYYLIPVVVVLAICGVFNRYLSWPFQVPTAVRRVPKLVGSGSR